MKTLLEISIEWLSGLISQLKRKLHKSYFASRVTINSLAPKILKAEKEISAIRPYLDQLKQAIDTKFINNIALTGSYGSGKSTILRTFEHLYREYRYLNISLASFKDNKQQKSKDNLDFERKLEVSILQQMFYHVKPSQIPDSRFKRIVNLSRKKLYLLTGFVTLWSVSVLYLFKFNYIYQLDPKRWVYSDSIDWIAATASLTFFLGISFFIKDLYRLFKNSKINKLSIKGELELEANDKSVFNQHLEEILYFFERTEFNVVVIEDVDRFESTDIFTKLREINILINNSSVIKRSIKFVYAIKDEMFKDKNERVKFFEFIVPIIPFINPSNASEQLAKLINEANLQNTLSADFTSDVVTFIDDIDMRLLINIFHEYQLYKTILSNELKQDNLFAIIVYKNLYPHDFGKLQKRKGNLHQFFANKPNYIKTIIEKHRARIIEIEEQINIIEADPVKTVKELRAIYIVNLLSKLGNFQSFTLNGAPVNSWNVLEDQHFNVLKNVANIQYIQSPYGHNASSNLALKSIEKEVSSSLTYDEREKIIIDRAKNKINLLKIEIENVKSKISDIGLMNIKELFETMTEKSLGHFNDNNLMRSLLLNGYIDEHYDDYISLFHGVNLTKEDFVFESKIKSGHPLPFDYSLYKIENLVKRIPDKYFKKEEILNYQLITFLLENEAKHQTKFNYFFSTLSIDREKQFEFINGFITNQPDEASEFIKNLCVHKPTLWFYIKTKSGLPETQIFNLVKHIFEHAQISDILKLKELDSLNQFLEEIPDLFSFCSSFKNITNLEEYISKKTLRFKALDLPSSDQKRLFEFIYFNNYYQINDHNISKIAKVKEPNIEFNELHHSNYTTIVKHKLNPLREYLDNNIEDYILNVMTHPKNTNESEEVVIDILNKDIALELKERVLNSQAAIIHSINDIDEIETKKLVISKNKLNITWENVFNYFDAVEENEELDDILLEFLNNQENNSVLSKTKLKVLSSKSKDYIKKVSNLLLRGKGFTLETYTKLLDSLPYVYNSLVYTEYDNDKIDTLLNKKILALTPENHKGLKEKDRKFSNRLIEIHQSEFIKKYTNIPIDLEDWELIFQSNSIGNQNKLSLIKIIDDSIIIDSGLIAKVVCEILPINTLIPLRYDVLYSIFEANNSTKKRISLLILHWANLDDSQVQSLVEILGDDYRKVFIKQHKPLFLSDELNVALFTKLKERDLIMRFEQKDKDGEKLIRVYAKYTDHDESSLS